MTQRDRLIELLHDWGTKNTDGINTDSVAEYLLENNVMVLPCKVGDTVYHDSGGFGILDYVIEGFAWNETGIIFQAASDSFGVDGVGECLDEIEFYESDLGKTVFFTPEEAEKALKGGAE